MEFRLTENLTYNETIQYINNSIVLPLESQISSYKTLMWVFIIIALGSVALWFLIKKKIEQNSRNVKEITTKTKEIELMIAKLKEGRKINQIDIRDLPKNIKEDILNTQGFWGRIFGKIFIETDKQGHKPPFLLLIKNDMTAEIKHNAKEGELILIGKDKNKTKKRILLSRQKLIDIKLPNGKFQRMWVHFEDEAESYPLEPIHHSKSFYYIVEHIQMTKGLLGGAKGKFPKIIFIIAGIILIGGGALWYFSSQGTTTTDITTINNTIQTINNTINNTITNITTTPQYNVIKV